MESCVDEREIFGLDGEGAREVEMVDLLVWNVQVSSSAILKGVLGRGRGVCSTPISSWSRGMTSVGATDDVDRENML